VTVVVVANPKGGVGKSTVSTQLAGYFARQGRAVMLGDVDRQQSARQWLALRPAQARPIVGWDASRTDVLKPPPGTTHVVLDTPAGLHGKTLKEVLRRADKLIIPVQPSLFDIYATRAFADELLDRRQAEQLQIAVVGMRVDPRTLAAERLREFAESLGWPVLAYLRDTQVYVHLAAQGLTLFDVRPAQVERDLAEWAPIGRWIDA